MPLLRKDVKPIDAARAGRWLFLAFSLLGLLSVWSTSEKIDQNANVLRYPSVTQGEITQAKLRGRGAPYLEYAYLAMGKTYRGEVDPNARSDYRQVPHVGDSIEVTFSKEHPAWSIAGDVRRQPDYGLSINLSWAFVVLGLIGSAISQFMAAHLKKSAPIQSLETPMSRQQRRALERKQKNVSRQE